MRVEGSTVQCKLGGSQYNKVVGRKPKGRQQASGGWYDVESARRRVECKGSSPLQRAEGSR